MPQKSEPTEYTSAAELFLAERMQADVITFVGEVGRVYLSTPTKIAIIDHEKKRTFVWFLNASTVEMTNTGIQSGSLRRKSGWESGGGVVASGGLGDKLTLKSKALGILREENAIEWLRAMIASQVIP
ncbi:hypothetical protein C5167_015988 [Papaver somniferum]|nr:hypothetical protein C5167_015988 [Papaver somniferum]